MAQICIRTGWRGEDATGRIPEAELLPEIYLRPYLAFAPELAWVADDGTPAGYLVGVADTAAFADWLERVWLPPLRARYPLPGSGLRELLHHPELPDAEVLSRFPAHLHLDLLPHIRGRGCGRALMTRFLADLTSQGVRGVHLGVDPQNHGALGFYRRLSFTPIEPEGPLLGLEL